MNMDDIVRKLLKKYYNEVGNGYAGNLKEYCIENYPRIYDRIRKTYDKGDKYEIINTQRRHK